MSGKEASCLFFSLNLLSTLLSLFLFLRVAAQDIKKNVKADLKDPKQIASPMPGNILQYKVVEGQSVRKGDPVVIITAMKMETVVVSLFLFFLLSSRTYPSLGL